MRRIPVHRSTFALLALVLCLSGGTARAQDIAAVWQEAQWGESSRALLAHFGGRATVLPRPLDFGDSYAELVLRDVTLGGVPLIAYFQMDKRTGGLKRIQFERPRHRVNPPVFRTILAALESAYGAPDLMCGIRPGPAGGYQTAADRIWQRDGVVIRAVFRGTSLEAVEGCLGGDLASGPCGLPRSSSCASARRAATRHPVPRRAPTDRKYLPNRPLFTARAGPGSRRLCSPRCGR
jgi:hypothetical protein